MIFRSPTHQRSRQALPQGFTLIEVLVAVAVFSITVLMAVNIFIIFVQQQRRTLNQQELQNDARAVMEQIARDVREGSIDYEYYATQFSGTSQKLFTELTSQHTNVLLKDNCLVLRSALNDQILYRLNGAIMQRLVPTVPNNATACSNILTGWENISPDTLTVGSFIFTISPSEDPFAALSAQSCGNQPYTDSLGNPVASAYDTPSVCRWGTLCRNQDGSDTCQNSRDNICYCFPQKFSSVIALHPRVTFSLSMSRTSNQQTISQTFQSTVASRLFKNLDRLNAYVP